MAKIFWVQCPNCRFQFYASTLIQGTGKDLMCPECKTRFPEGEGKKRYDAQFDATSLSAR